MAKKRTKKTSTEAATAVQFSHKDGEHHVVGLGNLRVVIIPDGKFFFAQGLEIDYCAQGATVADVKKKFEAGLKKTINQNLKVHGSIKPMLRAAPDEVWQELVLDSHAMPHRYFQVSGHHTPHKALPYEGIDFLVTSAAA